MPAAEASSEVEEGDTEAESEVGEGDVRVKADPI